MKWVSLSAIFSWAKPARRVPTLELKVRRAAPFGDSSPLSQRPSGGAESSLPAPGTHPSSVMMTRHHHGIDTSSTSAPLPLPGALGGPEIH